MSTLLFALFALTTDALAMTPQEVMEQAQQANAVTSSIQRVEMTIVSKSGSERKRSMDMKVKKKGEVRMTLAEVTAPSDEAGTKLLLVDNPGEIDEQLFYLPATKQTMRVSGRARKGAFMGSDFSYEDFELDPKTGTHTMVEETDTHWVIDTDPGEDSQYGRLRSTVSKATKVAEKVEFFDDKDEPLKVLEVSEVVMENGKNLARRTEMSNVKKGSKTVMKVLEQQIDVSDEELPDEAFTKAALER